MFIVRSKFAVISQHFSTVTKLRRVQPKYKPLAIAQAQDAITEYLSTTRSLSYTHAEQIATNATVSIQSLILKIDYSAPNFSKSLRKHLSYHPINEFEFFFESIGIDYGEISEYWPQRNFFFYQDPSVLDVACALFGFGFPWNKLGMLYKEERLVFSQSGEEVEARLVKLKDLGFSAVSVIGVCLAIPRILCGEIPWLLDKLKRLFQELELFRVLDQNVDSWYGVNRKIRVFYELGCANEEMWELMGRNKSLFMEYSEEDLMKKTEYFCRFGVEKEEVALLILRYPDIMDFDLDKSVISVRGLLKHFGLNQDEVDAVAQKYPYVLGRNKLKNLPHVLRALNLRERIFDRLKNGNHHLLTSYSLVDPDEDLDNEYQQGLEEILNSSYKTHYIQKLDFLHEIGFGENGMTMKVFRLTRGTAIELQDRFQVLLNNGIEFSKICMLIKTAPKIMNQNPQSIQDKLNFLCTEIGDPLEYLESFPAYLSFNLENIISPRVRLHIWLGEKGLSEKSYAFSSMVASSEKTFITRLYRIHPAVPKHWFECFSNRKSRLTLS